MAPGDYDQPEKTAQIDYASRPHPIEWSRPLMNAGWKDPPGMELVPLPL
jgi:hypothetical protein